MQGRRVEFVIAGSGAGGATLANELAKRGKDILVVEKGKYEHKFGTLRDIARFYDLKKFSRRREFPRRGFPCSGPIWLEEPQSFPVATGFDAWKRN